MKDEDCVRFLQWLLPKLQMRWPGFRKVRRQVCKRIQRRLIELGLHDVAAYQAWIDAHPDELQVLDGFCRITISRFYRDRGVFKCLRDQVLPGLAASARENDRNEFSCWSAGCASGEEPYTLSIIWQQEVAKNFPGLTLKIVATDSDPQMLQRAMGGRYPASSLKDLPEKWMASCFEPVESEYCVRSEYRPGIEWSQQDIRREMPDGPFDLIFCRHLALTYFDEALQVKILEKIVSRLRPNGVVVIGKQETLPTTAELVELQPRTGLYRKRAPCD